MVSCRPKIVDALIAVVPACAVCKLVGFKDWDLLHLDQQWGREGPLVVSEAQNMLEMQEQRAVVVDCGMSGVNVLELMAWQRRSLTMCLSVLQGLCGRVEG